MGIKSARFFY